MRMSQASATWATEFAKALENAASEVVAKSAGQSITMAEFAPMIREARRDIRRRRELSEYRIHFGAALTDAVQVLRDHPGMSQLIGERASAEAEYGLTGLMRCARLWGRIVSFAA